MLDKIYGEWNHFCRRIINEFTHRWLAPQWRIYACVVSISWGCFLSFLIKEKGYSSCGKTRVRLLIRIWFHFKIYCRIFGISLCACDFDQIDFFQIDGGGLDLREWRSEWGRAYCLTQQAAPLLAPPSPLRSVISGRSNDSTTVYPLASVNFPASSLSPLRWRWVNWYTAPVEQNALNDNAFLSHLELNWLPESRCLKSADRTTSLAWKTAAADSRCRVVCRLLPDLRASVNRIHE